MLKVGLTGGVACGKSTILEMFARRGAHVLRADEIGREMMQPGHDVFNKIVQTFGRDILDNSGHIIRAALSEKAFNGGRINELNAIVHPAVINEQDRQMSEIGRRDPHAICIVEAALMVEAGAHKRMDKLIAVTCPMEEKVRRFAKRTGMTEAYARAEVERRMAHQLPDAEKVALANYVIDNSGTLQQAEIRVQQIWMELRKIVLAQ